MLTFTESPLEPSGQLPIAGLSSASTQVENAGSIAPPAKPAAVFSRARRDTPLVRSKNFDIHFLPMDVVRPTCSLDESFLCACLIAVDARSAHAHRSGEFVEATLFDARVHAPTL